MSDEKKYPEYSKLVKRRDRWLKVMISSGVLVVIPPLFGLGGTVFGMVKSFRTLSVDGTADPEQLAGDVSLAMMTTVVGICVSVLFAILFFVSLILWLTCCSAVTNHPERPA